MADASGPEVTKDVARGCSELFNEPPVALSQAWERGRSSKSRDLLCPALPAPCDVDARGTWLVVSPYAGAAGEAA